MGSGKVFIIEDDFINEVGLAETLRKGGLEVATGKGDGVLDEIAKFKPGIVITDVITDAVPGGETGFLKKMLENEQTKNTEIFVYTSNLGVSIEVQLRKLKLNNYFTKDKNTDFIVKTVQEFFMPQQEMDTSLQMHMRGYASPTAEETAPAPVKTEKETFKEMFQEFTDKVHSELGENDAETIYNLGISYMDMGMFQEAISEFDKSAKDETFRLESVTRAGCCMRSLGKYPDAVETFKKAAKLTHDKVELMGIKYEIGITLEEAGRFKDAFNMLASVYKDDKGYRDVHARLVNLKKKLQG